MLATRKLSMILLAASVAVPALYVGALAFYAYWDFYRRGLPFDGMGAMTGLIVALGLGASLCAVALLHYIVVSFKQRASLSAGYVIHFCLFVITFAGFALALSSVLRVDPPRCSALDGSSAVSGYCYRQTPVQENKG
jgi:hypothetical protein